MKKITTMVDLFCGAGIGAMGFKEAGYNIIWAVDNNKHAVNTYNKNIGNHAILSDIKKIPLDEIPDADVYTAGFPCQPFSLSGKGEGVDCKKKGDLGQYFLSVIEHKKPKAFMFENVAGITTKRHKEFFNNLIDKFDSIGYNVTWELVNCWDYGVPQSRKRVFAIGIRKDLNKKFVFPEKLEDKNKSCIRDAIGDLPKPYSYPDNKGKYRNHYFKEDGYSNNYLSRNRQRQWEDPSFTIVSSCRHLPLYPEPKNYDIRKMGDYKTPPPRRFTVRECLRLQSVPDSFYFEDSVPIRKQYERCSGIPSLVAYIFSKSIKELIDNI
jgi:DNA (cytosine-5)-methyltransferase 1